MPYVMVGVLGAGASVGTRSQPEPGVQQQEEPTMVRVVPTSLAGQPLICASVSICHLFHQLL